MSTTRSLQGASQKTADDLRAIAHSQLIRELTPLTLPEVDAVVDLVARVLPAGNVPGVILNGLARLPDRRLPLTTVRHDINLLFKGVEQALDRVTYSAFFAGPATVIWVYQNLLKIVGKNPDDAFPEGTWQFYVEYALRDDTARHANETHGFDTVLTQHNLRLSEVDRMTAWVMAAVYAVHQYPVLLENEWRERVYTFALRELTIGTPYADRYKKLYRAWETVRLYGRGSDVAPGEDYPLYRRRKFDHFIDQAMRDLPSEVHRAWLDRVRAAEAEALPAYQQQMSILAYLEPGPYGETRLPFEIDQVHVAIIHRGHYHLLPICAAASSSPIDYAATRSAIAALVNEPVTVGGTSLASIARVKCRAHGAQRGKLNPALLLLIGGGAYALSQKGAIDLGPLAAILNPATSTPTVAASSTPGSGAIDQTPTALSAPLVTSPLTATENTPGGTSTVPARSAVAPRAATATRTVRPSATAAATATATTTATPTVTPTPTPLQVAPTLEPAKPIVYQIYLPVVMLAYRARR